MSTWYDGKEISIKRVNETIKYSEDRMKTVENLIQSNQVKSFSIFYSYILSCHLLCNSLLYLNQFDRIKDIRKKCAITSYRGQEIFGFKAQRFKYLLHDAILSRDVELYKSLAEKTKKIVIVPESSAYKDYSKNSFYSLVYTIIDDENAKEYLSKFKVSEISSKDKSEIGIGEAQALSGIIEKDKKNILNGILSLFDYRIRIYKKLKQLPIDELSFGSYLLYLAKDKGIEINIRDEIPKKYHIIIPDVLNIE